MFRLPVSRKILRQKHYIRMKSSSSYIRSSFIDYFVETHGHKHVKSSSVASLCDSTVPFVNAGMNQFKGVFLGRVDAPHPRVVNSQKCVRVGGKHNDLDVVGTDGHHHTFFEMLGNWSFGDYYKKDACKMAWDLLLGPYRLKPEELVVTYFSGDAAIGIPEDRECKDIWRSIGVQAGRLKGMGAKDNFWEMGATGPCGPCTEIHYVNKDGSLTEIWNIVFIQCNRDLDGNVKGLWRQHVDTGMGLERLAALLQGKPSNYDTDLFAPIIQAIQQHSAGVPAYGGGWGGGGGGADGAYRRLADHARMVAVCLADGVLPACSLNLKQIMRRSFKISTDVFQNPYVLAHLYDEVARILGTAYPELVEKSKDAKLVIAHEEEAYRKMRSALMKKWKGLAKQYPEVEALSDVEMAGFALGYKEFKEMMAKQTSQVIPGELVFKLYDTYGFHEDLIDRIAQLNNLNIDKKGFWKLLAQHKSRHKTAMKEQASDKGLKFDKCIETLIRNGVSSTNDQPKYDYNMTDNKLEFKPLKTNVVAVLNEDIEWIDHLDPCQDRPYYLVSKDTNFFCEEGGQIADRGVLKLNNDKVKFNVESVFKIREFVFHKGYFSFDRLSDINYVNNGSDAVLEIDVDRRLRTMKNHTAIHLLNAAVRRVLPNSVVYQIGSSVTDKGLHLNLSVYGEKLSQEVMLEAQDLVRKSIESNVPIETRIIDGVQFLNEPSVLTVPGEFYPETGLRLVSANATLVSKELCCGTHVPTTGVIGDFCVTLVRGGGGHTPTIHALTGDTAKNARELFCRAQNLEQVIDIIDPERKKEEISTIRSELVELCGTSGAPYGEYAQCIALLDRLQKRAVNKNEMSLQAVAEEEVREAWAEAARQGRRFVVHFLRCSYLMQGAALERALAGLAAGSAPGAALLLGCAGGVIVALGRLPQELVTQSFTAERWLRCVLPVFQAELMPTPSDQSPLTYAQMTATKVSLITCEQQVQDAMRVAIKFAQSHAKDIRTDTDGEPTEGRQQN